MSENVNPDRITYSETRTINVGQYENITTHFTYSGNIKSFNKQDNTVEISHTESQSISDNKKDFRQTAMQLMKRVKKVLNTREVEIRRASRPFIETEHELTEKSYVEFDDGDLL